MDTQETPPTSRRERPAKTALTREAIVMAALRVMRDEGLPSVTMRRVAAELDTGAASLYVYLRNASDLQAEMLDHLLSTVPEWGDADGQPWDARLLAVLGRLYDLLIANPGIARGMTFSLPTGPHGLDLVERILGLLDAGGVAPGQAAYAVNLLIQLTALAAFRHDLASTPVGRDVRQAVAQHLAAADPDRYPRLAAFNRLPRTGIEERLDEALRVIIAGLTTTAI